MRRAAWTVAVLVLPRFSTTGAASAQVREELEMVEKDEESELNEEHRQEQAQQQQANLSQEIAQKNRKPVRGCVPELHSEGGARDRRLEAPGASPTLARSVARPARRSCSPSSTAPSPGGLAAKPRKSTRTSGQVRFYSARRAPRAAPRLLCLLACAADAERHCLSQRTRRTPVSCEPPVT